MNSNAELKEKKIEGRKNKVFSFSFFPYDFVKWTGALPTLIALRPRGYYESKLARKRIKGAQFVIANHESYIDPISMHLAFWNRRIHLMATQDLFKTPKWNRFFKRMLCIPVNKENFNYSTFKEVEKVTSQNGVVGIFPEGAVNRENDKISRFHSGVILMALKCKVPIVPMYMKHRDHWYERLRYIIGEPINIEEHCNGTPKIDDIERLSEMLHNKEAELKAILEQRLKKRRKE